MQSGHIWLILFEGSLQNERQPSTAAQELAPSENNNAVPLAPEETEPATIAVMNQDPEPVSPSTVPSNPPLMEPGPFSVRQKYAEPKYQNTIHYLSLAEQPFDPVQLAQKTPVEQEEAPRNSEPLLPPRALIQPVQLAPMDQQSTLPPYQPSYATKQQMLKFLNYGPPAPTSPAPQLAPAAAAKEAFPSH